MSPDFDLVIEQSLRFDFFSLEEAELLLESFWCLIEKPDFDLVPFSCSNKRENGRSSDAFANFSG